VVLAKSLPFSAINNIHRDSVMSYTSGSLALEECCPRLHPLASTTHGPSSIWGGAKEERLDVGGADRCRYSTGLLALFLYQKEHGPGGDELGAVCGHSPPSEPVVKPAGGRAGF